VLMRHTAALAEEEAKACAAKEEAEKALLEENGMDVDPAPNGDGKDPDCANANEQTGDDEMYDTASEIVFKKPFGIEVCEVEPTQNEDESMSAVSEYSDPEFDTKSEIKSKPSSKRVHSEPPEHILARHDELFEIPTKKRRSEGFEQVSEPMESSSSKDGENSSSEGKESESSELEEGEISSSSAEEESSQEELESLKDNSGKITDTTDPKPTTRYHHTCTVFLVPTVPLVTQQANYIRSNSNLRTSQIWGGMRKTSAHKVCCNNCSVCSKLFGKKKSQRLM
jgi:hypothetical protein